MTNAKSTYLANGIEVYRDFKYARLVYVRAGYCRIDWNRRAPTSLRMHGSRSVTGTNIGLADAQVAYHNALIKG